MSLCDVSLHTLVLCQTRSRAVGQRYENLFLFAFSVFTNDIFDGLGSLPLAQAAKRVPRSIGRAIVVHC
jgi:hypothetical protein